MNGAEEVNVEDLLKFLDPSIELSSMAPIKP
jgi:hypothetical protein